MSQTFKQPIDKTLLFDLLDKICVKTAQYYLFDLVAYKKGDYNKYNTEFCETIIHCYHKSKQFYAERKLTYSRFCTLLRQICNSNNIIYTTKTLYTNSQYDIQYFIYFYSV
jgi:hypothetical protein